VSTRSRTGTSLVEVLVALTILTIAGTATHAALTLTERLGRQATAGTATDRLRWETVQAAAAAPACRSAPAPVAIPLTLPATPERPALTAYIRCGP
jgi:Tfp pilus assembly protein PilV